MNILGNLELQADTCLPKLGVYGAEAGIFIETHHARVELFDDIVEVHFRGLLAIARVPCQGSYEPVGELCLSILAEDLELAHTNLLRNQERCEQVRSFALD